MNNQTILIVGEDDRFQQSLASFLSTLDLNVKRSALLPNPSDLLGSNHAASLIIVRMSDIPESPLAFLRDLKTADPEFPVVVLTGASESRPLLSLLRNGLIDQVAGLDNLTGVYSAVKSALARKELTLENKSFLKNMAKLKLEQSRSAGKTLELREIYDTTLENLMTALDLRDVETFGHSQTVAKYSQVLAKILGIQDKKTLDSIRRGALLHDVGKIAIPDSILKKPGRLTPPEWEKIKLHPSLGYGLIKEIKLVREAGNIILYHHEKYDGTGYPGGLTRTEIPLEARVFALADALDAMTSQRPYRKERNFKAAQKEIRDQSGKHFDPRIVEAFCRLPLEKWEKIRFETTRLLPAFMDYRELALKK